jgi:hypothetical protein
LRPLLVSSLPLLILAAYGLMLNNSLEVMAGLRGKGGSFLATALTAHNG